MAEPCHRARRSFLWLPQRLRSTARGGGHRDRFEAADRGSSACSSFDPAAYGTASALRGIQHATGDSGDFVSIVNVPAPESSLCADRRGAAAEPGSRRDPRGRSATIHRRGAGRASRGTPRSSRSDRVRRTCLPAVAVDHYGGAAAITRHLLESRSPHGVPHRGPDRPDGSRAASRGMARHAGRRRGGAPAAAGGRLEGRVGVRARAPPCRQGRRHRDLRGQRPDGPRRPARAVRRRPARAARRQRRRL